MAKNLKLNIKNTQIAQAIKLDTLKEQLAKKKAGSESEKEKVEEKSTAPKKAKAEETRPKETKEEAPRIRARSKSAFAEGAQPTHKVVEEQDRAAMEGAPAEEDHMAPRLGKRKSSAELRREIFGDDEIEEKPTPLLHEIEEEEPVVEPVVVEEPIIEAPAPAPIVEKEPPPVVEKPMLVEEPKPIIEKEKIAAVPVQAFVTPPPPKVKLGPTGRHINDLLPPKPVERPKAPAPAAQPVRKPFQDGPVKAKEEPGKPKPKGKEFETTEEEKRGGPKTSKFKEFKDVKPAKKVESSRFDARDRHGLREVEEEGWRKKRSFKHRHIPEDVTIRPTSLKVRIPISIKDLAVEMKLKASQLVSKLFLQGLILTLNDLLEDETTIQLLGQEFGCEITIDTTEEERIKITSQTIQEEIKAENPEKLMLRPPIVAFMGHVDHGKTSLIDTIRKSNRVAGEAGAITQHIGAFRCHTAVGDIAILDTPGHEAFSAMRARGANVTDIVVLVVAGDEGIRQQTVEAIQHAKAAGVTIVVAINKCDKPNFNAETVYRQLSENDLLPESWGGQTITVNCSAVTGEGIPTLLEMLALQAEVLELRASHDMRARGSVLESELHKGMGAVATVLVQNGTLRLGDALVFDQYWGRVKTMRNELGKELQEAGPSTPIEITGLSGVPEAGQEFIVVKNEREAREIAEARTQGMRQTNLLQMKKTSMEHLFQQAADSSKKILNVIIRADVQGSLEALKSALQKIESKKVDLNIILGGVGEVSESDVQLAAASKALIIGFHTQIESHAQVLVKELGVQVRLHDIIYHAIDDVKVVMGGLLDKIAQETDKGVALVKATFKSSHYGIIAGCIVDEGSIHRNNQVRVKRDGAIIWTGSISSLKRVKEDVREVAKGLECGIVLNNFNEIKEGDEIQAYEVTYISQQLS